MKAAVVLVLAVVPALAGCTLLKDEEPFEILLVSQMDDASSGAIVVTDGDGDEVFRKPASLTRKSIHTAYHIPALDGTHTVAWESGGQTWSDTRPFREGDSVTIVLRSPTEVCFEFRQATGNSSVCDAGGA